MSVRTFPPIASGLYLPSIPRLIIQPDGRSEWVTWFRAIGPKSNSVIRVAVCETSIVTIIGTVIHK
jgi:hypothetical protein